MDAKERLRLYLEQRRDLGESELVLDSLSVDDVLKLLGAARGQRGAPPAPPAGARPSDSPPLQRLPPPAADAAEATPSREPPADWRAALQSLREPTPTGRTGAPADQPESHPRQPRSDAERAPSPPPPAGSPGRPESERPSIHFADRDREVPHAAHADLPPDDAPSADDAQGDDMSPAARGRKRAVSEAKAKAERDKGGALDIPDGLVVGGVGHELFDDSASKYRSLDDIAKAVQKCEKCRLFATAKNGVPGEGNPQADLMCVGEAPGANEDESGRPFVGQAGQLLTKILAAIDLAREDVFIANVLKHRPPGNRDPLPDEVAACSPYLVRQIELIKPKVIIAFGTFAAQTLLQTKEPLGKLRGRLHRYHGVPLIVTYHPAALLRNPSWKRPTWEDVQLARRLLDRDA